MCNATTIGQKFSAWVSRERLGEEASGCWLDSARGRYIGEEVQSFATSYGWTLLHLSADDEYYCEAWDEAEAWLNENVADEHHYFGSNESGDWGLWPIDDDSDD
jgi:hypothetical protein